MTKHNTFGGWIAEGRAVRKGERAQHDFLGPDGERYPAFAYEQTEPLLLLDTTDMELVPRDTTKHKPVVHINHNNGIARVWVGNKTKLVAALKAHGYRFSQDDRRWVARRDDISGLVQRFSDEGYEVKVA